MQIIAELAQGFEGRAEQARLLLVAAATAGADAAKYQLVIADELAVPGYKHYDLFKSLEMPDEVWHGLSTRASASGIELQLDIFGSRSLHLAVRLGVTTVKLHGTDIANRGLLAEVAASAVQTVLLGAGGGFSSELDEALDVLAGKQVVVLLGFQGYPTPDQANQIARVRSLVERFATRHPAVRVGFADHALPTSALRYALAATAVGAGAAVVEKHLTLGRIMALEDHESALNPDEFAEFVGIVRACSAAMGSASSADDFGMSAAEHGYRTAIRRHVVAARSLPKGTILAPADLALKRTAADHPLTDLQRAYERTLKRGIEQNEPLFAADIE